MCRILISAMAVAMFLGTASAEASCIFPDPPASIPDGTEATYEQMVAAHTEVREFDEDVRTFNVCLELEVKTLLDDPAVDENTKEDLRRILQARVDDAVDQAEFVVEEFNKQLRAYNARNQ